MRFNSGRGSKIRFPISVFVIFASLVFPFSPAFGHEDEQVRIEALTQLIGRDPRNADLYLKRGELHFFRNEYDLALADLDRVLQLDSKLDSAELLRAKALLGAGKSDEAREAVERVLSRHPNHAEARLTRARILFKQGRKSESAGEFTEAISLSREPTPEFYLERAQAQLDQGDDRLDEALRGLDEGLKKLGPAVALELRAMELELKKKNYGSALNRLDAITAQSPRKETWLARRGEILEQAGRNREALTAYQQALAALQSLPAHRRSTPATADLESRLRRKLQVAPEEPKGIRKR